MFRAKINDIPRDVNYGGEANELIPIVASARPYCDVDGGRGLKGGGNQAVH